MLLKRRPSVKVLIFNIGTEAFALDVRKIQKVVESPSLNPIPLAPPFFRGAINFHNRIIPVLDMAAYLKMFTPEQDARVIVLDSGQGNLGLSVSSIENFSDLEEAQTLPAMSNSAVATVSRLVNSKNERHIHILDPAHLKKSLGSDMASKCGKAGSFSEAVLFEASCESRQELAEEAVLPSASPDFSLSPKPKTSSQ
jgi:purine-binding chemotaxis protein CheW